VGRKNDVICPIVTIVVFGLVICDYVRGIPTLGQSYRHIAILTYDSIANHANNRCQKHDSFPRIE
jgi:hypothetical protein